MSNIKITIEELLKVEQYLDIIEENLNLKSSIILDKLERNCGEHRSKIRRTFEKIYYSSEFDESLSSYIKRRQNKEGLLVDSSIVDCEDKFVMNDIFNKILEADIINKYKVCKLYLDKQGYYTKDINYKKALKATFTDEVFLYFDFGNMHNYNINNIVEFNETILHNRDTDNLNMMIKEIKLNAFYTESWMKINGISYIVNNRNWIHKHLPTFGHCSWLNLDMNPFNYKTIFSDTKDFLRVLMKINDGIIGGKYKDILNENGYNLKVTCEEDVELHYKKSVEEIKKVLNEILLKVFNNILCAENGELKEEDLSDQYYMISTLSKEKSAQIYKKALMYLLVCGYVFIK